MIQTQQSKTSPSSFLTVRLFDFINLHPSQIQHISFNHKSNKFYVARKLYSEVYTVSPSEDAKNISLEQIMVFEPCQEIYEMDGLIVLVLPFELKVNFFGKWIIYPFTTQLLPQNTKWNEKQNKLYTYHVNECRQWSISQDGVDIRHLNKHQIPYHITAEGALEGYGKKIKPNNFKDNKFTKVEESQCKKFLFIGSDRGHLHIYETKYLTHVKTFHRHEAAILSIVSKGNICYFTGSDSKISSIVNVVGEDKYDNWVLSKQIRGQSHDIFSIQRLHLGKNENYLVSGGITTDLCFYKLTQSGLLTDTFAHKVSYSSEKLSHFVNNYTIVNKHASFEIWKIGQSEQKSKQSVQLLVKYQMPFYKSIRQIIIKEENKSILIFVTTQQQASLWQFDQEVGLNKLLTVKNNYNIVNWYKKDSLVTIRDGNNLELFNYKTGQIQQVAEISVQYPTDLKISPNREDKILIGSKFSKQVEICQLNLKKQGKSAGKFQLNEPYNIIDFCYYNPENVMIKLSSEQIINQYNKKGEIINEIIKLPATKIRDFGWLSYRTNQKNKIFWYAVSEGKIIIVSRMRTSTKLRKIRVKQMPRIASVIANNTKLESSQNMDEEKQYWNLGVIPLNFSKMIAEQINPIMTKKIL